MINESTKQKVIEAMAELNECSDNEGYTIACENLRTALHAALEEYTAALIKNYGDIVLSEARNHFHAQVDATIQNMRDEMQ